MAENHTDITIELRASPKQANPDLLELPTEIDPWASIAVETTQSTQRNVQLTTGWLKESYKRKLGEEFGRDLLVDCFALLLIFWGKSDISKTNIYNQFQLSELITSYRENSIQQEIRK